MSATLATRMCCAVLVSVLPSVSLALSSSDEPQGVWRGLIQQGNADVALRISFGPQVVKLHFEEPLSCDVTAQFLKVDGETWVYRFRPSVNGGRFCDSVMSRELRITRATPNQSMNIAFDTPRATWRGRLQEASAQ
jgi:hypothetical protein